MYRNVNQKYIWSCQVEHVEQNERGLPRIGVIYQLWKCSAILCKVTAALGTTGQREVNKPPAQCSFAKQKSECLTRSILFAYCPKSIESTFGQGQVCKSRW